MPTTIDHDDAVELPSSSGRDRVRLALCDRGDCRGLVLAYEASVYDDRSIDPVVHVVRTPCVRLRGGSLEELLELTRRFADALSSPEPPVRGGHPGAPPQPGQGRRTSREAANEVSRKAAICKECGLTEGDLHPINTEEVMEGRGNDPRNSVRSAEHRNGPTSLAQRVIVHAEAPGPVEVVTNRKPPSRHIQILLTVAYHRYLRDRPEAKPLIVRHTSWETVRGSQETDEQCHRQPLTTTKDRASCADPWKGSNPGVAPMLDHLRNDAAVVTRHS